MNNAIASLRTFTEKVADIELIAEKLESAINKGSAEHFIEWHNKQATADKTISDSWYRQYLKETK